MTRLHELTPSGWPEPKHAPWCWCHSRPDRDALRERIEQAIDDALGRPQEAADAVMDVLRREGLVKP